MELIRKQTVLNMIDDMQFDRYHTHAELELMSRIYQMVNSLEPVDAVEVVRCKDCKHWVKDGNESIAVLEKGKTMDEIKLKPCPFCGGEPYFYTKSIGEENGALSFNFRIACRRCQTSPNNAYGDIKIHLLDNGELSISPDDRKKVAAEWNRRVNDE